MWIGLSFRNCDVPPILAACCDRIANRSHIVAKVGSRIKPFVDMHNEIIPVRDELV